MTQIKSHSGSFGYIPGDENACSVIALEHAFRMTREDALYITQFYGRKKNCGMLSLQFKDMVEKLGAQFLGVFGCTKPAMWWAKKIGDKQHYMGMSIARFKETFSTGTYIVFMTGHYTVIEDGKLMDANKTIRGGASVILAWKVR